MTNDQEAPNSMPRSGAQGFATAGKQRILIIDDSEAARMTMEELLFRAGYETMSLSSAIGATRTILRNAISLVVADISMPGLSGDRLVTLLRENARLKHLGIVIVSGRSEDELNKIRRSSDADAVLSKSDIEKSLVSTIESVIGPGSRVSSTK